MTVYDLTVPQLIKMLRNVDRWLVAAIAQADRKKYDVNNLLKFRLAPDQFAFDKQVQSICDNAKLLTARLAGKDPPVHPDTESSFDQLRTRIATVIGYLDSFTPDDFAGAAERRITLPWMDGKWMRGDEYLTQFALANAYTILRHNGIELGKRDFIGGVAMRS